MKKIMIVAPHPDDEVLGCGGYLLRAKAKGDSITWVIGTEMTADLGFSESRIQQRDAEIKQVAESIGIARVVHMKFPTTQLDSLSASTIIQAASTVIKEEQPEVLLVPTPKDAHSDHRVLTESFLAASKTFRAPSLRQILAYETISETDALPRAQENVFAPNYFVDVSEFITRKIEIAKIYQSEMASFPFPRSEEAILSLAKYRGSQCGYQAAECFELLLEKVE